GKGDGVLSPEPDVQPVALAHHPAVAAQVAREGERGQIGTGGARALLGGAHLELDLARDDRGGLAFAGPRAEPPRHRAEVPPRADHDAGRELAVQHPAARLAAQVVHLLAEAQARAAAREQVVVELAAADPVAHDLAAIDARLAIPLARDGEAADRL